MSRVSIGCIVEGKGEELAVPFLVRRIARETAPFLLVQVPRPHVLNRKDINPSGTEVGRAIRLLLKRLSPPVGLLLILDADDDDPLRLQDDLAAHLRKCRCDVPSAVIVPCREYEAWFLAAAESLRGHRGLRNDLAAPPNADAIRGAKEWLVDRSAGTEKYRPTVDQAALTDCFDMAAARANSPSFAHAYAEIARLLRELVASLPGPRSLILRLRQRYATRIPLLEAPLVPVGVGQRRDARGVQFGDLFGREVPADRAEILPTLEIRVIPDGSTAASALQTGEVDFMQYAPFDLLPLLEKNAKIKVVNFTGGNQFAGAYRINPLTKPFDDPAIRRVLWKLVDQREVIDGLGLDAKYGAPCASFFTCGTPYANDAGTEAAKNPSVEAAKAALKLTKYAGEPVIVMQASDLEAPRISAQVLAEKLKQAGFTVDLQVMDWASLLVRRTKKDGWSVYGVHAGGFDLGSPLTNGMVAFNCVDISAWHCDARLTPLLTAFAKSVSEDERKKLAYDIQAIMYDQTPAVPWGQFAQPAAYRSNLRGVIPSAIPIFWNIEK